MTSETQLIEWQRIKSEIALYNDIAVMGKMNYSLEAIQKWAKQSKQSLETQNEIAEYRLRLNRKQGEWIAENIPEEGGGDHLPNSLGANPTLAEAGIDYHDSPKFRVLARIPEAKFENYIREIKEGGTEELTTRDACHLINKAHIGNASGENEWYTPAIYTDAAYDVMGSIDVDPASTEIANKFIKAKQYFTTQDDGRTKQWLGNVWMNPPYSQPLVTDFCNLLIEKLKSGEVKQACVLVNNATETSWYQNMLSVANTVCFIKGRVKFLGKEGSSGAPLQGQTILYFGENYRKFAEVFSRFGVILYADK